MAHFHVTGNVPGFLPENDTYCVDNSADAAKAIKAEVMNLGLDTAEGCDRDGCNVCGWCRKSNAILARTQGDQMELIAKLELDLFGSSSWSFDVPCSPGYTLEATSATPDRSSCDYSN